MFYLVKSLRSLRRACVDIEEWVGTGIDDYLVYLSIYATDALDEKITKFQKNTKPKVYI